MQMQPEIQFLYILIFVLVFFMIFVAYILQVIYDKQSMPFSTTATNLNNTLSGVIKIPASSSATFTLTLPDGFCFGRELKFALLTPATGNDSQVTIQNLSHATITFYTDVVFSGTYTIVDEFPINELVFNDRILPICRHDSPNSVYKFRLTNTYITTVEIQYETTLLSPYMSNYMST